MDRRTFITNALLSAGFLAATAGAASALPILPSHDTHAGGQCRKRLVVPSAVGMALALSRPLSTLGARLLVHHR